MSDFELAMPSPVQLVNSVHCGQYLHGTDSVQHVRIMARSGSETTILMLA